MQPPGRASEAVRAVYPELYVKLSSDMLGRAAKADEKGERLPFQVRQQIGRFVGVQMEPAFKRSVVDLIDGARQARDAGTNPRPSAPPNLASSAGPESVQIQQREASVG